MHSTNDRPLRASVTSDEHAATPQAASLPAPHHALSLGNGLVARLYLSRPHAAPVLATAPDIDLERDPPDPVLPPLLLVHSINAAASAFEMEPVFVRESARRPVFAVELPGFGAATLADAHYTPALMRDAVIAAIDRIVAITGAARIDLMALSLGGEFATDATLARPARVRSLALISPTGMESRRAEEPYEGGRSRELGWLRRALRGTSIGRALWRLLVARPVMRFFLSRTFGGAPFDPRLLEHGQRGARQQGAHFAPLDFVAGSLFTRGIIERYRELPVPVWVVHGRRGSFTDFDACPTAAGSLAHGRTYRVERTSLDTGAMPHFEVPDTFAHVYQRFLDGVAGVRRPPAQGGGAPLVPNPRAIPAFGSAW
jgi:pimeloyl-ACP methyl ester carboxylesterase